MTGLTNVAPPNRSQDARRLAACLFHPISNRYSEAFYVFIGQVTAVHYYIPRTLHSIEDVLDPLLSLQQILKVRPISYDYAQQLTKISESNQIISPSRMPFDLLLFLMTRLRFLTDSIRHGFEPPLSAIGLEQDLLR